MPDTVDPISIRFMPTSLQKRGLESKELTVAIVQLSKLYTFWRNKARVQNFPAYVTEPDELDANHIADFEALVRSQTPIEMAEGGFWDVEKECFGFSNGMNRTAFAAKSGMQEMPIVTHKSTIEVLVRLKAGREATGEEIKALIENYNEYHRSDVEKERYDRYQRERMRLRNQRTSGERLL